MMRQFHAALVGTVVFTLALCAPCAALAAGTGNAQSAGATDGDDQYMSDATWLCRPGRPDICSDPGSSTDVERDGSMSEEHWAPDPAAAIDCFYVYPTVSLEPRGNSSLSPGVGETRAVAQQFAPFASVCRPYAPVYRQVTLAGLVSRVMGQSLKIDPELAYDDVLAAWRHYLRYDNHGRGVVLIGHSQGARILIELMRREIDGKPDEAHLVSALLLGMNVEVPTDKTVGGSFQHIPLCTQGSQTGCVISYMSFRAGMAPGADSQFGHAQTAGMQAACTDPAALSGTPVHAYLSRRVTLLGEQNTREAWQKMADTIRTPFVTLPGLIEVGCVRDEHAAYLAVSMHPQPGDARPADIPGDLVVRGQVLRSWGLHIVDMNLVMGNLIAIVRQQSTTYVAAHPRKVAARP